MKNKIISREDSLNTFINIVSKYKHFNEELKRHIIVPYIYMFLTPENINEFKNKIKNYHMNYKQNFIIVNNEDNMTKFIKNGFPKYSIIISDYSPINKTSLGKFDQNKLLEEMLLNVGDIYKFDINIYNKYIKSKNLKFDQTNFIALKQYDSIVNECNLIGLDIIQASKIILSEIIKLSSQIKNKYSDNICDKNNVWSYIKNKDGEIIDIIYEIKEKFILGCKTQTTKKYEQYVRYFDLITYMIETIEYKLNGEIEDSKTINELYYQNISEYANGFIYLPYELDTQKYKIVKSKISINGSRIKNLKDYILNINIKDNIKNKIIEQIDKVVELSQAIINKYPNSKDNKKLLTKNICFIDKSYVVQHMTDIKIFNYQTELNNLLNMISEIKDN